MLSHEGASCHTMHFRALEASTMHDRRLQLQLAYLLMIVQLWTTSIAIVRTINITVFCTDGPTYNSVYTYQPNMSATPYESPIAAVWRPSPK